VFIQHTKHIITFIEAGVFFVGDNSYGDGIWCRMGFCAQKEEIGVGDGFDSILARKITV